MHSAASFSVAPPDHRGYQPAWAPRGPGAGAAMWHPAAPPGQQAQMPGYGGMPQGPAAGPPRGMLAGQWGFAASAEAGFGPAAPGAGFSQEQMQAAFQQQAYFQHQAQQQQMLQVYHYQQAWEAQQAQQAWQAQQAGLHGEEPVFTRNPMPQAGGGAGPGACLHGALTVESCCGACLALHLPTAATHLAALPPLPQVPIALDPSGRPFKASRL